MMKASQKTLVVFLVISTVHTVAFQPAIHQVSSVDSRTARRQCRIHRGPRSPIGCPSLEAKSVATPTRLKSLSDEQDDLFDASKTAALIGGQSLLIAIAVAAAFITKTPNFSFGPGIDFGISSLLDGAIKTAPLGVIAYLLDLVEEQIPALQQVTKATQRSVLALLGVSWKPATAMLVSLSLGLAAGFGEEMIFRGILQYELAQRLSAAISIGVTSILFGFLHAVTPLYAFLATLASMYFGYLYHTAGNLAVPITTHSLYDMAALLYAHWTVSQMSRKEQEALIDWDPSANTENSADKV